MTKFFALLMLVLLPLSLCGMAKENLEKEKPTRIREGMRGIYAAEDANADIVINALRGNKPISEIMGLLNTLDPLNINSIVKITDNNKVDSQQICTILRCSLEYSRPGVYYHQYLALNKLILQKSATLKQQRLDGWCPYLVYAITTATKIMKDDDLEIVKLLVDNGANVNFHFGEPVLHCLFSCYGNSSDKKCIDYLLKQGADANARDSYGKTPLGNLADRFGFIMKCWKAKELQWTPDFELFEHGVKSLLEHGADINAKQKIYDSPHSYIEKSNYELLNPLMSDLDAIIKRADAVFKKAVDKKMKISTDKRLADDLKVAAEQNKYADRSIIIKGNSFNFNEGILSARCPNLCLELNPNYSPQFRLNPLRTPLLTTIINDYKQTALKTTASNFGSSSSEQTNQEID